MPGTELHMVRTRPPSSVTPLQAGHRRTVSVKVQRGDRNSTPLGKYAKVNITLITSCTNEMWAAFQISNYLVWKSTYLKKGLQMKGAVIKCFQERPRADQEFEPKAQGLRSAANVCRAGLEGEQRGGSIRYQQGPSHHGSRHRAQAGPGAPVTVTVSGRNL